MQGHERARASRRTRLDEATEIAFRIRDAARTRERTSQAPLPYELFVNEDGSAVVSYEHGERFVRYESLTECLLAHDLARIDLDLNP